MKHMHKKLCDENQLAPIPEDTEAPRGRDWSIEEGRWPVARHWDETYPEPAPPWPTAQQIAGENDATGAAAKRRPSPPKIDGQQEAAESDGETKSEQSQSWGDWKEEKEEDERDETVHRSGESRRPRRTTRMAGERRRGKTQAYTYKAGAKTAIALIAVCPAECHSFVQVCDQDEMRLAYLTIFILLCSLFFACVCICKLYCSKKSSFTGFINSPVRTSARTHCLCRTRGECGGAS